MTAIGRPPKGKRARELYDQAKADREELAYKLRMKGRSVTGIAEELGVSDRQVRTYLQRVENRMKADLIRRDGEAGVLKQFMVLSLALDEALDAWERSKAPVHRRFATRETNTEGLPIKTRVGEVEETQVGNPAYLDAILKASRELRELLGMDAPTVRRVIMATDQEQEDVNLAELQKLPADELLARYRALMDRS